MDLLSYFRRRAPASSPAAERPPGRAAAAGAPASDDGAGDARARARRRLIGAVVLLGIGVVAFPLLFETEPRPIPVDLPIEIPKREALPPLAAPSPGGGASRAGRIEPAPVVAAASTPRAEPSGSAVTETAPPSASAARDADPALRPAAPAPRAAAEPDRAAPPAPVAPAPAPAPATPAPTPAPPTDAARARALLEGKPAPATAARFVVQVGAFADDKAVREVRAKVEQLGLRTYTQVVHVAAGDRTRVRIGPFDQREQAEATVARLKKAGLPATVMAL